MPMKAPSSILLSRARLRTPAWLQSAPPSAARRIGVARRMPLLSSSTVKTLKNPSMSFALSFQAAVAAAGGPLADAADVLMVQFSCCDEENDKANDRPAQLT